MTVRYFAYGSNLLPARLERRCPSARALAPAALAGHALCFHKRGADGSGKCDAVPAAGKVVWGVVHELAASDLPALDRAEPGYVRVPVVVEAAGRRYEAFTYRAGPDRTAPGLQPYAWYRDLIVAGARAHGLPARWIAALEAVPAADDPDPARAAAARALLAGG